MKQLLSLCLTIVLLVCMCTASGEDAFALTLEERYIYHYFSPEFLLEDDVSFNPETGTIEQAGYKAIVLYENWLTAEGAEKLLSWAKQGLRIAMNVVFGALTVFFAFMLIRTILKEKRQMPELYEREKDEKGKSMPVMSGS